MRARAEHFLKFYTLVCLCWYSHWLRLVPARSHDVNTRMIILTVACINGLYLFTFVVTHFSPNERWDECHSCLNTFNAIQQICCFFRFN